MTRSATALSSLASLVFASAAIADVSPGDVWANQGALFRAMGGNLSATLREGGTTTEVTEIRGDFALPMSLGSLTVSISDIALLDNGDGSVTMRYPDNTDIELKFDIPTKGAGSVTIRLLDAYEQVARGDPGDVTYTYDAPTLSMEITEIDVSGPGFESPDMAVFKEATVDGMFAMTGNIGRMRVTEGDMLTLVLEAIAASQEFEFTFGTAEGITSSQKGSAGATVFSSTMSLAAAGISVMALPAALRDGLSIQISSETEQYVSAQMLKIGDEVIQDQKTETERLETTIAIDADGLRLGGSAEGFSIDMLDTNIMPFPIQAAMNSFVGSYEMPLLSSDEPLPFAFRVGMYGVSVAEDIWSLFDAGGTLPRDPIDMNIDLNGKMGSEIDLLDFQAMKALEAAGTVPFSIHELTVSDILLSAVGASLTGSGAFTFDMNDLETFDGMPAPTGALDLKMVGANGLIDTLIAAGLLPEDQAMGARMMLGLFARPGDGEDTLTSKIEVDGTTGAISANGQRLK